MLTLDKDHRIIVLTTDKESGQKGKKNFPRLCWIILLVYAIFSRMFSHSFENKDWTIPSSLSFISKMLVVYPTLNFELILYSNKQAVDQSIIYLATRINLRLNKYSTTYDNR